MLSLFMLVLLKTSYAEIRYSLDSYVYAQKNQIADSIINPANIVLKSPHIEAGIDMRGEIKWRSQLDQLIFRPRIEILRKTGDYAGDQTEQTSKTRLDVTDAFYEGYLSENLSITAGLQVYQWGPAEIINATNPFYHFNSQQKSNIYKEKGRVILRGNYSFNKENSLVAIVEPVSNNEEEWIAENNFHPKGVLKYEKLWSQSGSNVGFLVGSEDKSNFFAGEYFTYSPFEGFSLYGEAKHAQKHINYVPQPTAFLYDLVPFEAAYAEDKSTNLGVFGLRWEDDFDVRAEYIYNGAGFDKAEMDQVFLAAANVSSPNYLLNLKRFERIGLEILGRQYVYFSFRVSEPFKFRELNFALRHIRSLQDESGTSQLEIDKSFADAYLIFLNASFANGDLDAEFRIINDWQILLGLKWSI